MKTQQTSIIALLLIAVVFTSCQKDSMVDMDILADNHAGIALIDYNLDLESVSQIHRIQRTRSENDRTPTQQQIQLSLK